MKKIKMKRNREVGDETYKGEQIYTLPDEVADGFLNNGHAELIENIPDEKSAPERKSAAAKHEDDEDSGEGRSKHKTK